MKVMMVRHATFCYAHATALVHCVLYKFVVLLKAINNVLKFRFHYRKMKELSGEKIFPQFKGDITKVCLQKNE